VTRIVIQTLAWVCIAAAVGFAVQMHHADRRLQRHRSPETPAHRYALAPARWQREIYLPEGVPLVDAAWRSFGRMIAAALLGMLLLALTT
jgi:hypothetical protein